MKRFHFLDGLRAMAVLMIVVHHSATSFFVKQLSASHLSYGGVLLSSWTQSGVELFFVLSGVVLLRPYYREGRVMDGKTYYWRRFLRIYPPYFVAVCFASLVIFLNTFFPNWFSTILVSFTSWHVIKQFLIFNQSWDYFNLAWWSLQIEISFYLVVPLILRWDRSSLFQQMQRFEFLGIIVLSLGLQIIFSHYFPGHYSLERRFSNLYRIVDYIPAFYMGIVLAKKDLTPSYSAQLLVLGVFLVLMQCFYMPLAHMGYAFIYGSLINLLFLFPHYRKSLENWFMVYLGERSYSLFLVHLSVFYMTNYLVAFMTPDRSFFYGALTRLIGIPLAFFGGLLLFWFVERRYAKGLITAHHFWPIPVKVNS